MKYCPTLVLKLLFVNHLLVSFIWSGTTVVKKSHYLSASPGYVQLKDKNLHPKVHGGLLGGMSYGYLHSWKNISAFTFSAGFSRPKTSLEDLSASVYLNARIAFHYLFPVKKFHKSAFHFGPGIGLNYNLSYYPQWDDSHLYWGDYFNFGVWGQYSFLTMNRKEWRIGLGVPLVGMLSRPKEIRREKIDNITLGGILSNMHSSPEPSWWGGLFYVNANIEYVYPLGKTLFQSLFYGFSLEKMEGKPGNALFIECHTLGLRLYI